MGKIDENKQLKLDALLKSAYDLFLNQGIAKTSVHDITKNAGVAKGTFYLYFKDKYALRDHLIASTAQSLFQEAHQASLDQDLPTFEDHVIFVVDYIINQMIKNKPLLRFVSKNLSWGIFSHAMFPGHENDEQAIHDTLLNFIPEKNLKQLKNPEIVLFMILELASSSCYSSILENNPVCIEELKPHLYNSIRAILKCYTVPLKATAA